MKIASIPPRKSIRNSITMTPRTFILARAFALIALAYPVSTYPDPSKASELNELTRRGGTTSYFGDYTGSTSSYPDGSGSYSMSEDVGTHSSGIKCWTDLVSLARTLFCDPYPRTQWLMMFENEFYVKNSYQAQAWTLLSDNAIDCGSTSSCSSGTLSTAHQVASPTAST